MAKPSPFNPLRHIIERQYSDHLNIKNKIFKERLAHARNLFRKDLLAHYGCVNAIEFSWEGDLLVSGGDDRRILLWSVPETMFGNPTPIAMDTTHVSNIFCLAFNANNTKIFSGGNDDQVIIHDTNTGNLVGKLAHKKPVYGLSVNPHNDHVLATAGDDGRILLFDVREPNNMDAVCLAKQKTGFHSVMFNPANPRLLTTANAEAGIALWDCRKPKDILIHYDSNAGPVSGISACFNSTGSNVLALRRRLPPVLYATQKQNSICQFYHPQYYNSCTMKTCCFAGDNDEYVLSGSDDFNLYVWKTPPDDSCEWGSSHVVLNGHRSIVNQVRYNKANNMIASSGVEKMIRLWSTLPIGTWEGSLQKDNTKSFRNIYTHEDYIYLVGHTGERISHDYSDHSTQEDVKMLAFFDSLIQREIEGWESSLSSDLSDCDSDESEGNPSSILNIMYGNRNPRDDSKMQKPNRISLLIATKRCRLAKMAHGKSKTEVLRHQEQEMIKKKKFLEKLKAKAKKYGSKKHWRTTMQRETHKKFTPERIKGRKYRTRQSVRETYESTSSSLDTPSTSTGITGSSNSVFRLIEQDSDEDLPSNCVESSVIEENNFVNILPTPLNGTHDMYINVLEMTNNDSNSNAVSVRADDYNQASTSRDFLNILEEVCASSSNGVMTGTRCRELCNEPDSDTDYEYDYHTPVKKRRTISASDSGCGTGSSRLSIRDLLNHQECSSNNRYHSEPDPNTAYDYDSFRKRVSKAKLNISKQIGAESDSN